MKRLTNENRRILDEMDVDAAMKNVAVLGFIPDTRENAEAGMHKARLMTPRAWSRTQREESRRWLRAHAFKVPGQPG